MVSTRSSMPNSLRCNTARYGFVICWGFSMHITPCGRARSLTSATGTPYGYQFPIYRVANDCLTAPIAFFTWVGNVYRLPMLQWRADAVEPVALPYGL